MMDMDLEKIIKPNFPFAELKKNCIITIIIITTIDLFQNGGEKKCN